MVPRAEGTPLNRTGIAEILFDTWPSVVPATSYLLSLLALKLTTTRRVSHADDLATDPGAALFAGLATLPKATASISRRAAR